MGPIVIRVKAASLLASGTYRLILTLPNGTVSLLSLSVCVSQCLLSVLEQGSTTPGMRARYGTQLNLQWHVRDTWDIPLPCIGKASQ